MLSSCCGFTPSLQESLSPPTCTVCPAFRAAWVARRPKVRLALLALPLTLLCSSYTCNKKMMLPATYLTSLPGPATPVRPR